MNIAFLVYDSRSGSTLLSREVANAFENVFVTPEIGFDSLLASGKKSLKQKEWALILKEMYRGHEFINFDIPYEDALQIVCSDNQPLDVTGGIKALIKEYTHRQNRDGVQWVIVKNGSHLQYWKEIKKIFGHETVFFNIIRDPRAVINSKLKTRRPYHNEVMAWGGVIPAVVRWKLYARAIQNAKQEGVKIYQLKFEELIADVGCAIDKISVFLDVSSEKSKWKYQIPDNEQQIHDLVLSDDIVDNRVEAWMTELPINDRYLIEALCEKEMNVLGYKKTIHLSLIKKIVLSVSEIPGMTKKILNHFLLKLRESLLTQKNSS